MTSSPKPPASPLTSPLAAIPLAILTLAASLLLFAQNLAPPPPASRPATPSISNLILLDPAHGGPDSGATLPSQGPEQAPSQVLEKDVTLALAARLRATLTAAGFSVASTRDTDPPTPLTPSQRAEIANRAHPLACLVLHATATGSGVHLYTSTLPPPTASDQPPDSPPSFVPTPWETAQSASIPQSLALSAALTAALAAANLPTLSGRAPLPPLDNLTCPAVAIELAPLTGAGPTPVTDPAYQQRVAAAVTAALRTWRDHPAPTPAAAP